MDTAIAILGSPWFDVAKGAVPALALLFAMVSAAMAFGAYRANLGKIQEDRIRERDKELLGQIIKSYQWAYDSLLGDSVAGPPDADRLNWLTCARHLLRAEALAAKIQSDTYRLIQQEHQDHWRHTFYLRLDDPVLRNVGYFSGTGASDPDQIEPGSARVIIRFSTWAMGAVDPIDGEPHGPLSRDDYGISDAIRGYNAYVDHLAQRRTR